LILRRARRDELEPLLHLLAQDVIRDKPEELGPPIPQRYVDAFEAIDRSEHQQLIVAELEGRLVGTLTLNFVRYLSFGGTEAAIVENVRVDAAHRSRGIGEAMMQWANDEALRRGATRIQLTSNTQRLDAHRFYERLGYTPSHVGFKKILR
jgi:GNAT superfamily N-acetyltransferase